MEIIIVNINYALLVCTNCAGCFIFLSITISLPNGHVSAYSLQRWTLNSEKLTIKQPASNSSPHSTHLIAMVLLIWVSSITMLSPFLLTPLSIPYSTISSGHHFYYGASRAFKALEHWLNQLLICYIKSLIF